MRSLHWPALLASLALLVGCGGDQPAQDTLDAANGMDSAALSDRMSKSKKIFYSIPSPMETAALLKKAGAEYNKNVLNDPNKNSSYTAASKQALNLGVYGADLSYASVYNNTHESMLFTAAAQNLAKQLNISTAFSQETVDRMEANQANRDSLLNIISETYWDMDQYLKTNERENISALMIAGGWVEGLYIATQVAKTNDTPELRQRIAEQKLSLGDLIALVSTYQTDEPALAGVLADLHTLEGLFASTAQGTSGSATTEEGGVTVIGGGGTTASLTDAELAAIREKTAAIRNTYIN
ncbi:MAG: hypothetical protein IPL52_14465 [Flavobacteriales bacterium]|nr:hypothetical protein [Flavobacteriales bacterium]